MSVGWLDGWMALLPLGKKVVGFESWAWPFCVGFEFSPCACVGLLQVPPNPHSQKRAV